MSRSAADATRFTATGPYANSKPGSSRLPYNLPDFMQKSQPQPQSQNHSQSQGTGQPGQGAGSQATGGGGQSETPREKVERLRAQTRAARAAAAAPSGVDRMIEVGRRVANRAHKTMVYALIATSGACGVLTVYSMVSLTLYNRRQRLAWLDNELEKLQQARLAYANETATPEQLEVLRNEKIGEIMQQKKDAEKEQRPWNQAKRFLFGGMMSEEADQGRRVEGEAAEAKPAVLEAVTAKEGSNFKADGATAQQQQKPGQLDVLADNAESAVKQNSRSWFSWFTGR
ncbi:hypothetical protein PHISP_06120 [Aspergillus sp. HF37]|nr:hypothetical protein PHISP_06120 [Aspergillus sp. HF37]